MKAGGAAAILMALLLPKILLAETLPAGYGPAVPPNALTFAVRAPLPGAPGFLQTVKYVDDGMVYVDPLSQFFISAAGELCFRTRPNYPTTIYENFYRVWCIHPRMVDRVEAVTNPTVNEVRLWCMRAYPQCVHSVGDIGRIANSVSAQTIDYRQERAALENLVHMMGGNLRLPQPLQ
jgi:hypothetical protein